MTPNWQQEFDKKYGTFAKAFEHVDGELKSFISSILNSQKQQIRKEVEEMETYVCEEHFAKCNGIVEKDKVLSLPSLN